MKLVQLYRSHLIWQQRSSQSVGYQHNCYNETRSCNHERLTRLNKCPNLHTSHQHSYSARLLILPASLTESGDGLLEMKLYLSSMSSMPITIVYAGVLSAAVPTSTVSIEKKSCFARKVCDLLIAIHAVGEVTCVGLPNSLFR